MSLSLMHYSWLHFQLPRWVSYVRMKVCKIWSSCWLIKMLWIQQNKVWVWWLIYHIFYENVSYSVPDKQLSRVLAIKIPIKQQHVQPEISIFIFKIESYISLSIRTNNSELSRHPCLTTPHCSFHWKLFGRVPALQIFQCKFSQI